jgi:hypothetical protein
MRGVIAFVLVSVLSGTAVADEPKPPPLANDFDAAAAAADRLRRVESLVWSLTASCDQGDDNTKRQCRTVRDATAARLRGKTLIVDVPPGAFEVGSWDAAKKSTPLTLRGCVACGGVVVDDKTWYVVSSKAAPTVEADKVLGAPIHTTARSFKDEAAAVAWRTQVVPRLRTQLLIKVPAKDAAWTVGGKQGLAVDVVGFRVYDTCDGEIVCASPTSGPGEVDKKACGTTIVEAGQGGTGGGGTPVPEKLPAELSKDQIMTALRPVLDEARRCAEQNGATGDGKIKITIGGDGSVIAYEQTGAFKGTPTGACIDVAVKNARFPRSRKPKTTIAYPISVR